ncbi:MAG: glutathione S-transferase family protein [Sphingomonas sp.]|uniref:glutathione S-transferase family protein n=1 Tax=Sphingomonas sp. TaxID=28214 RepID=UPI0017B3CF0B|nr:glutathione S-transferase family protein [Sphingomonas sp.]MBA3667514.1 glutathione S-transferase family protein [Sphingomonas sp.]
MGVKLYGVPLSPNVRGAMLGLAEKGVDYELIPVLPADFKTPEQLALNPFGRVPVLDHDGFVLYETQAILRYVDQAFPGPALAPSTAHEAARMNQIIGIIDCYLFKSWSGDIGLERLIAPKFFGRPSNLEVIEAAVPVARNCAEALEALIAAPYLTGETFSLADIRLMPHFDWFRLTPEGETILAGKSKLAQWFQLVSERASAKRILQQ